MTNPNGKLQMVNVLLTALVAICLSLATWILRSADAQGDRITRLETIEEFMLDRCTGDRCDSLEHRIELLER